MPSAPGDLNFLKEKIASLTVVAFMKFGKLVSGLELLAGVATSSSTDGKWLFSSSCRVSLGPFVKVLSVFFSVQLPTTVFPLSNLINLEASPVLSIFLQNCFHLPLLFF